MDSCGRPRLLVERGVAVHACIVAPRLPTPSRTTNSPHISTAPLVIPFLPLLTEPETIPMRLLLSALAALSLLTLAACEKKTPAAADKPHAAAAPTNRVDIPAPVRRNLGITFARVEPRNVARTLRVPGRFEHLPTARREYRLAMGGKVELLVAQYQKIEVGTPLYRVDAPAWRELQNQIAAARAAHEQALARAESMPIIRAAHKRHEESLEAKVALWSERMKRLQALAASGAATSRDVAESQDVLNATEAELADNMEKDAELVARERELSADVRAAHARLDLLLATAALTTGLTVDELVQETGAVGAQRPRWQQIASIEVRAAAPGVVETLGITNGATAEPGALVVTTVQPEQLRFRARALQADIGRLQDGLGVRIVPPSGGTMPLQDAMAATLSMGLGADPDERTIELLATPTELSAWARAGMAAHLEVTLAGGEEELAIPLSCVVRDGARPIIFRRDPADPDKAIRMDADLGLSDGRWIVIASGVKQGDEIVLDGAYQLMLATAGNAAKGGHFHSDGTFHEGEH